MADQILSNRVEAWCYARKRDGWMKMPELQTCQGDKMRGDLPKRKVIALVRGSTNQQDMLTQQSNIEFYCSKTWQKDGFFGDEKFMIEVAETVILPGTTGIISHKRPDFKINVLGKLEQHPEYIGIVTSELSRMMRPQDLDAYAAFKVFRTHRKLIFCDMPRPLFVGDSEDRRLIANELERSVAEREKTAWRTQGAKERLILDPLTNITRLPQGVEHIIDSKVLDPFFGPRNKKGYWQYTEFAYTKIRPAFERIYACEKINRVAMDLGFSNESSLRSLLSNKWWIGVKERVHQVNTTYGEEEGEKILSKRGAHPVPIIHETNLVLNPLMSPELYEKVQTILGVNHNKWSKRNTNEGVFLFKDFLFCGKCGRKMYPKNDLRTGQPPTYICSSVQAKGGACGMSRIKRDRTDQQLWDGVPEKNQPGIQTIFRDTKNLVNSVLAGLGGGEANHKRTDVEEAKRVLADLQTQKERSSKLYKGTGDEQYYAETVKLTHDISSAKIRLATAKAQAEPFGSSDAKQIAMAIQQRFLHCEKWSFAEKREGIADVIEKIVIKEDGNATLVVKGGIEIPQAGSTWSKAIDQMVTAEENATAAIAELDVLNGKLAEVDAALAGAVAKQHAKVSKSC